MKNIRVLSCLMLLLSGLLFLSCTSDPIPGPPGMDGVDGIDGVDGMDGVDGTTSCVACHSASYREPIEMAYENSGHGMGGSWARGTNPTCARCHNNEGFQDYLSGLFIDSLGFATADTTGYAVSNPISCTGCHDKHRSFDFENDGNDFAVRTLAPVDLFIDPTVTIDIRNASDELGRSNLCIHCHQPRADYEIPGPTADYEITSSRFGPHHGPQSTILEGIMGAHVSGSVGYPGVGSAGHRQGSSCIACHMGETTDGSDGDHTWVPTENTCITCHTNGPPAEVAGFAEDFQRLHDLLVAAGAINDNGTAIPGTYPANVAQAAWNYITLAEDKSEGVHNPNYVKALLKNSIDALEN